jgi:hypothetical protein
MCLHKILTLFLQGVVPHNRGFFSSPISQFVTHFSISYIGGFSRGSE